MSMQAKDWHLFVMCHDGHLPRYTSTATIHPMRVNASTVNIYDQIDLAHSGWKLDCQGDNISELNKWWSELTGIYWIVNNASEEFIGNAQYRRKWRDDGLDPSSSSVLYIPEPEHFHCSVAEQYAGGHQGMDGLDQVLLAASRKQLPLSPEEFEAAFNQNIFYGHIMARGHCELYRQFMRTLLDCMWPIWDNAKESIYQIEGYNRRYISFLAERVMTALVLHRDKVWPGLQIETAPIQFFGP